MKIEKLNDNQIRCTLDHRDLEERQLELSELTYGSDKAKLLFRDMMQQAFDEFGFESDNTPLMVEVMPHPHDGLVLIVTRVLNPNDFQLANGSDFADDTDEDSDPASNDYMEFLEAAGNFINMLRHLAQEYQMDETESEDTDVYSSEDTLEDICGDTDEDIEADSCGDADEDIKDNTRSESDPDLAIDEDRVRELQSEAAATDTIEDVTGDTTTDMDKDIRGDAATNVDKDIRGDAATDVDKDIRGDAATDVDKDIRDDAGADTDKPSGQAGNSESGKAPKKEILKGPDDPGDHKPASRPAKVPRKAKVKRPGQASSGRHHLTTKVFSFPSLDDASCACETIRNCFSGRSRLYKDPISCLYYLTLQGDSLDTNQAADIVVEFGRREKASSATLAYFDEHFEILIRKDAVSILANL